MAAAAYRAIIPQQATEPSGLDPHVCSTPALTEANSPPGGVDWPKSSSPQQATEPSGLNPHVCPNPALTEANSPPGGVDWPW